MRGIVLLILVSYTTCAMANTYLQRFAVLESGRKLLIKGNEEAIVGRVCDLVQYYSWLKNFAQPTAVVSKNKGWHRVADQSYIPGLPQEFFSDERTILTYADGREVHHIQVAEGSQDYEMFLQRTRNAPPAIVSMRDSRGNVEEEFIYTERPPNQIHNLFGGNGFLFERFLAQVESPLINIASGGFHFSFLLNRLDISRQEGIPYEQRQYHHVFSLDIGGGYRSFISNQWYLFGNLYNTGLPNNTFGAAIYLGGPLKRKSCSYYECVSAIKELARITVPDGRLLLEFGMSTRRMISYLHASRINFANFTIYKGREQPREGIHKEVGLIEIVLDKYADASQPYEDQR